VLKPAVENPRRPIEGFACARSEVSGRRLWGLFRERFGSADAFFAEHFVANYCPLAFFDQGRNLTPDKLPAAEAAALRLACDAHLKTLVSALAARMGDWRRRFRRNAGRRSAGRDAGQNRPRAASESREPAGESGWAAAATRQLVELGIWE
jgi:single-strand selective monofunctional uracil DNA glycosylase